MTEITDPTFYRTPADAIAAEPESLAYVAAFDPSGEAKDAIAVMDCNRSSGTYGEVVGWAELPTGGNELHHFGTHAQAPSATTVTQAISSAATSSCLDCARRGPTSSTPSQMRERRA